MKSFEDDTGPYRPYLQYARVWLTSVAKTHTSLPSPSAINFATLDSCPRTRELAFLLGGEKDKFDWASVDFVTDRNRLPKLMRWVATLATFVSSVLKKHRLRPCMAAENVPVNQLFGFELGWECQWAIWCLIGRRLVGSGVRWWVRCLFLCLVFTFSLF
jgi:hypothetical protein